jgi:hypothetical protein
VLATIAMAAAVPRPIARVYTFTTTMEFYFHLYLFLFFLILIFIILENHMRGQMKGGEMKGSEARVVFITMDASWGMKKSPMCVVVEWYLGYLLGEGQ